MHEQRIGPYYLHQSYNDIATMMGQHQHRGSSEGPFARYTNVQRMPLQQSMPLQLGPVAEAFVPQRPPVGQFHATMLAQLLFYSYGFSRHDVGTGVEWPFHRIVPSARCLFPTELYVWLPAAAERSAGIYHYDVLHHHLVSLRQGDYLPLIDASLDVSLHGVAAVFFLASTFGRTAAQYGSFAYRLCTQEVGIVASNLLMVARTLGLDAWMHYAFLDAPLNRLIGAISPDESLMAVLPVFATERTTTSRTGRATRAAELIDALAPLQSSCRQSVRLDRQHCQLLIAMDEQAACPTTAAFRLLPPTRIGGRGHSLPAPDASFPAIDLADTLHQRSSGDQFFSPQPVTMSQQAFWQMLYAASHPYHHDLTADGYAPLTELRVVVARVAGVPPGVYHWIPSEHRLRIVDDRQVDEALRDAQPLMRNDRAAFVAYVIGDFRQLSPDGYERAYRTMHIESGLVSQRLGVLAAAHGCVARCSDSYRLPLAHRLLKLPDPLVLPLLQIAVGYEARGVGAAERYRLSLRF